MLRATGERLVPDQQRGELVMAEHLARYRFAAQFASGRRVLDAACGEGYGTEMLRAAGALEAIGVDLDAGAVAHARARYELDVREADVGALPFDDASFDLVVSFETIEHVADGARVIAEFRRVLRADGLLVVSTPNSAEYLVENEFHLREYTPDELDELLAPHFPIRNRLYQQNWLTAAILDQDQLALDEPSTPLAVELRKTSGLVPGRELYSIVVCGPGEDAPAQVAVMTGVHEANRLEAERRAWQERAEEAERQLAPWHERAEEAERQLTTSRSQIEVITSSLSWRVTRPLRIAAARLRARR